MSKRASLLVSAVGLLAIAAGLGYRHRVSALPASPAAAMVDDTAVSARELDIRLAQILPMASFHGNVEPSKLVSLRRAALDELILDELIYREAVKRGQSAEASAVDAELRRARSRFTTPEEYEAALAQHGMTESSFRRYAGRTVLIRQARQARADQKVTDADADAYYQANANMFLRPEQVHLVEILVKVDPADPGSAAPAERKAGKLAARIRAGEAFGPLARRYSEDDYRVKDGDFGLVHRGRLDTDLEEAVFAAPPGEVRVTRSVYGFHVFEVLERQAPAQLTFAEAKPLIVQRLTAERRQQAEQAWHAALLGAAKITIMDAALRDATPAQLPAFRSSRAMGAR
jgi:parvulin-like peptidyl-prolyl isomerase